MINYEALREPPKYKRDIYSDLKRIEERGRRISRRKTSSFWSRPEPSRD